MVESKSHMQRSAVHKTGNLYNVLCPPRCVKQLDLLDLTTFLSCLGRPVIAFAKERIYLSMANCNSSLHSVVLRLSEPFEHVWHTCYEPFASDREPVRELTDSILANDRPAVATDSVSADQRTALRR